MFNTIVVGVDGHEGGRDALALGERLRRINGGELIAVHAYRDEPFATRGPRPDFETALHRNASDLVEHELERAGVAAHVAAMTDGSPGGVLRRAVHWHDSDLIVVGSDRRGPIGRVLAGDVTTATLHGASRPVVVAPRGYAEHGTEVRMVGVGYDGSVEAHAAAHLARDLAEAAGARVRVIRVLEDVEAATEQAHEQLDDLLAELGDIATGEVVIGDPVTELAAAANDLDLLVTGSRGYGPVRRVMVGSTSGKLVHHAACPVLVVPRTALDRVAGSR